DGKNQIDLSTAASRAQVSPRGRQRLGDITYDSRFLRETNMSKLPFRASGLTSNDRKQEHRRRSVRSCPRLEQLEGRIAMSTFRINTTLDTAAVNLRTGQDAAGHISLRSAIMAVDARGGSNTIQLRRGIYTLTLAGADEDASATGDLDIMSNLRIKGAGSGKTIIDGNNLDRVFHVFQGAVKISGVTIQHG